MGRPRLAALVLVLSTVVGCAAPTSKVAGTPAPVDDPGSAVPTSPASTGTSGPSPSVSRSPDTGSGRTLLLPPLVRDQIIAAWVAGVRLEPGDVAGVSPGTAYYGYMPSTGTYWAVAMFDPTEAWERKARASPGSSVALQFQDGPWVFSHKRGQGWRYVGATGGEVCPPKVPAAMLAAWGLSAGSC
jgi:hypothetical protein